MAVIEGIVASVRMDMEHSFLTVYPIDAAPARRVAPENAIELMLRREAWQTDEGHRDHVMHMVGQGGFIEYADGAQPVIATIRTA